MFADWDTNMYVCAQVHAQTGRHKTAPFPPQSSENGISVLFGTQLPAATAGKLSQE